MAERIFPGCEDCYNDVPLREVADKGIVPDGVRAGLCERCLQLRREEYASRTKAPRPIGILADVPNAEWVDLPSLTIHFSKEAGGGTDVVLVKFRQPTIPNQKMEDGGEVRFKIPQNPRWFPGPILDVDVPNIQRNFVGYARSSVKHSLRLMFNHMGTMITIDD